MAISSGFFNSHDRDRRYTAAQLSNMFQGLITDGIYSTVGHAFATTITGTLSPAGNPMALIDTGRGFFNGYWAANDAPMTVEITDYAPSIGNRWDAVILEVDTREMGARNIAAKIIRGSADETSPEYPSMNTGVEGLYYWPLCYILREQGSGLVIINDGDHVVSAVGNSSLGEGHYTPFITGIIRSADVGDIWTQWNDSMREELENLRRIIADITETTILPGSVYTEALQDGAVTGIKMAPEQRRFAFKDTEINKTMFSETGTYPDYPYRGQIPLGYNVKATMIPEVIFAASEAAAGVFSPIAESYDGGIFVYARDINMLPDTFMIPTIVCQGGV